jgi:hypothetical protein
LLVNTIYGQIVHYSDYLPPIHGGHDSWRYTLISGVIPAIPLLLVRPFLPESPVWKEKRAAGTLKRPSIAAIFAPAHLRTTIVTKLIFACGYAAAFGAIQHFPQIVPGLPEVKALKLPEAVTAGKSEAEVKDLVRKETRQIVKSVQNSQELGGLVGRVALAFLAVRIASRGNLIRIFQIPGLLIIPLVFWFPATNSLSLLHWGAAFAGFCTVAQFSFWGNYLPLVYPTHLRGTGESFAANIGGRILGTSAFFLTTYLSYYMPAAAPPPPQLGSASAQVAPAAGASTTTKPKADQPKVQKSPTDQAPAKQATTPAQLAHAAAVVVAAVYSIGLIASFWLPEPRKEVFIE